MTKLYNEIKDLNKEDAKNILCHVSYIDLQREYKELADLKNTMVVVGEKAKSSLVGKDFKYNLKSTVQKSIAEFKKELAGEPNDVVTSLHDSSNPSEFVDTSRECIIQGCENRVTGRAKKCDKCKGAK